MEEKTMTRETYKKELEAQKETRPNRRIRIRLLPIWLRVLIVMLLIVLAVTLGAMFGYGVMGGGDAMEIFNKSTWTHILDLVNKEE